MTNTFTRNFSVRAVEQADDTVAIAISTETPYLRYNFPKQGMKAYEVLSHQPEEVDLTFFADDAAPFCFEHDVHAQIGVLKNVQLHSDGVLRADVMFSLSQLGQDMKSDMIRGIRKRISVGYEVLAMEEAGISEDGIPVIRCQWRPYEASTVSLAADNNAGVGRSQDITQEKSDMTPDEIKALIDEAVKSQLEAMKAEVPEEAAPEEDASAVEVEVEVEPSEENTDDELVNEDNTQAEDADEQEQQMMDKKNAQPSAEYVKEVTDIATRSNMISALPTWLSEGRSIDSIKAEVFDKSNNTRTIGAPAIIISGKRDNSFAGAVKSWLRNDNSELAERGIDQMKSNGRGIEQGKLYLPTDVPMIRSAYGAGVGTAANGVGREFLTWEETLRETGTAAKAGVDIRAASDVMSLPFWSAPATASNAAETGSVSISTTTAGQVVWAPKRVAARYKFTNMVGVLNGTYDFEAELTNDLLMEGARQFDANVFAGAGGTAPQGLIGNSNIALYLGSGSLDMPNSQAILAQLANRQVNVDNITFVVDNDAYALSAATGVFGNGSGKSALDALKDAGHNVVRTSFFAKTVGGTRAQLIAGRFEKVTAATFGALSIERDTVTQAATGETVLNMQFFMDVAARNSAMLQRWSNVTF